jgi:NADPH:quinone reductase-like Zn-dependent oxidoreductase
LAQARDLGSFAHLYAQPWPKVLGVDAAGVVLATGADVKDFQEGDRVAGYVRMNRGALIGSYQARVLLWSSIAVSLEGTPLSFADGATLPLAYSTATAGLNMDLGVPLPGEETSIPRRTPVLILGGAAAIGQMCLQLLRCAGFTNVITTASTGNHPLVMCRGARKAFDQRMPREELAAAIEKEAGGKLKYIYDVISAESTIELTSRVVDLDGGRVVLSEFLDRDSLVVGLT